MHLRKNQSSNYIRVSTLYKVLCIMCILMHMFLTTFFIITNIYPLMILNLISILIYLSSYLLIKSKQFVFVTLVCCIEIVLNVMVSSLFLGWDAGFYFYLFGFVPLCFYCKFKSTITRFFIVSLTVAFFLATYFISNKPSKLFTIAYHPSVILYLTNAFCCFCALSFLSYIYTKTIVYETSILSQSNKELEVLANTDPLTGLLNRRSMMKALSEIDIKYLSQNIKFSLILIDIDNFKVLNDKYGHECGDLVLKKICSEIKNTLRQDDVVCRWGGEEILILLPKTEINDAKNVANKIRKKIEDMSCKYKDYNVKVTLTAGVSCAAEGYSISDLINQADTCMYKGKASGKNRVVSVKEIDK